MIKLKGIKKVFKDGTTLSFNDFVFEANKSYCLLGPSGSGKTTLLNIIGGIVKPTEGEIIVDDNQLNKMTQMNIDKYRYQVVGYIPQDLKLFDDFNVLDNLSLIGVQDKLIINPETALSLVELQHKVKSKVKTLSGGEKQRVAIARALLKSPKVMLCDEPTGSLNFTKGLEIINLLIKVHKETKNTLIVVTHDDRMAKYFDMVLGIDEILVDQGAMGGALNA